MTHRQKNSRRFRRLFEKESWCDGQGLEPIGSRFELTRPFW